MSRQACEHGAYVQVERLREDAAGDHTLRAFSEVLQELATLRTPQAQVKHIPVRSTHVNPVFNCETRKLANVHGASLDLELAIAVRLCKAVAHACR